MASPTVDQFLGEIVSILRARDGDKLKQYLLIEPPLPRAYTSLVNEVRRAYPRRSQDRLEGKINALLPLQDEGESAGGSWPSFVSFLVHYFGFIRDVNPEQLLETYELLKALLKYAFSLTNHGLSAYWASQCILALSDASMGIVVLPVAISYSRLLAKLAIGLEKRPDLLATFIHRPSFSGAGDSDAFERVTLVESAANTIREAFKKCLSERSAGTAVTGLDPTTGRPAGRRVGIYECANLCLRLFFHCGKPRSAEQIFANIYQQSPALSRFPAAQRVTFLYYLGRYHFANNHFPRAARALQASYLQTPQRFQSNRRIILVYLITANIILGRFPSAQLLARPEATGLAQPAFMPLCKAIRAGDWATFRTLLTLPHPAAEWLWRRRLLLPLRNRAEPLVWRSLARRVFRLVGFQGSLGEASKRAPTLDLADFHAALAALDARADAATAARGAAVPAEYVDPDLDGADDGDGPTNGTTGDGDPAETFDDAASDSGGRRGPGPSFAEAEAGVASLVEQGLLRGYVAHRQRKFVVLGARARPALAAGFPPAAAALRAGRRAAAEEGDEPGGAADDAAVPGWVRDEDRNPGGGGAAGARAGGLGKVGPGSVINLKGARPIGVPG